jgi:hypothetical protein
MVVAATKKIIAENARMAIVKDFLLIAISCVVSELKTNFKN